MLLFVLSWAIKQLIFAYWLYLLIKQLPKTFFALYLWKSNLNEITGDYANENYEVNMWGKYCKMSRICNNENVFGSLISTRLDHQSYQPTTCLSPRNLFLPWCLKCSLPLAYRIFDRFTKCVLVCMNLR
jgi:hypothetical protein